MLIVCDGGPYLLPIAPLVDPTIAFKQPRLASAQRADEHTAAPHTNVGMGIGGGKKVYRCTRKPQGADEHAAAPHNHTQRQGGEVK